MKSIKSHKSLNYTHARANTRAESKNYLVYIKIAKTIWSTPESALSESSIQVGSARVPASSPPAPTTSHVQVLAFESTSFSSASRAGAREEGAYFDEFLYI